MRRDDQTGRFVYAADFTNTYLNSAHIRRKYPLFDGRVNVTIEKYHTFDTAQNVVILSSDLQIVLT